MLFGLLLIFVLLVLTVLDTPVLLLELDGLACLAGFAPKFCLSVQKGPNLVALKTRNRTLRTTRRPKAVVILWSSKTCFWKKLITDSAKFGSRNKHGLVARITVSD